MFSAFVILFIVSIYYVEGQENINNPVVERYIDRPLALHRNNLEFSLDYDFGALLKIFDEKGKSINMANEGIAASNQKINFQLTYGITERIQLQTLFAYYSYEKTMEPVDQIGLNYDVIETKGIQRSNGFIDPNLRLNYLLIKNERKLSISFGCGMSFPVAKYKPEKPKIDSINIGNGIRYNFLYNNKNGMGTPIYNLNLALKLRLGDYLGNDLLSKIIVRLYSDYYTVPIAVSTNDWQYIFDVGNPNGYTFQSLSLKHKEGDWLSNKIFIDWQAFNITSFQIGATNRYYFHGWNQTNYMKTIEYDVSETSLLFGAHIQASPRIRIDEQLSLPIAGKNIESYFNCQIALIYKIL